MISRGSAPADRPKSPARILDSRKVAAAVKAVCPADGSERIALTDRARLQP